MLKGSLDRSIRLVHDLNDINFSCYEVLDCISEGLIILGTYSRKIALHCIRVSNYSAVIGKRCGLSNREINLLWCAAIFHDIGKSNIPLEILQKPAKLTKEEYEVVKTHSHKGYEYVRRNKSLGEVSEIILNHHERFDGKGYPLGIEGQGIPLLSRIISVADAFDAMISERPYKNELSMECALAELKNGKRTQFDEAVVDCFINLIEGNYFKPKEMNIVLGLY